MGSSVRDVIQDVGSEGANLLRETFGLNNFAFKGMDIETPNGLQKALAFFAEQRNVFAETFPGFQSGAEPDHSIMRRVNEVYTLLSDNPDAFRQAVRDLQRAVPLQEQLAQKTRALDVARRTHELLRTQFASYLKHMTGYGSEPTVYNANCRITLRDDWALLRDSKLDSERDTTLFEQKLMVLDFKPMDLKKKGEQKGAIEAEAEKYRRTVVLEQEPGRRGATVSVVSPDGALIPQPEKVMIGTLLLTAEDWTGGMSLEQIFRKTGILAVPSAAKLLGTGPNEGGAARGAGEAKSFPASEKPLSHDFIPSECMEKLTPLIGVRLTSKESEARIYLFSVNGRAGGSPYFALEGKVEKVEVLKKK